MFFYLRIFTVLLLVFSGSCGEKSSRINKNLSEVLDLEIESNGTFLSRTSEITLEYTEETPGLGHVFSISVVDDYIVIVDVMRWTVEVFDFQGNYKWRIGSRGDNEYQYSKPLQLAPIPGTNDILIYDARNANILRFSVEGNFVGRIKKNKNRPINRMLVSKDHKLIYTTSNKDGRGLLVVSSLSREQDIFKFVISEATDKRLYSFFGALQGLDYDESLKIVYCTLPWEEKIIRIDLNKGRVLKSFKTNHPHFKAIDVDRSKISEDWVHNQNNKNFSRVHGMGLTNSGDILLRYHINVEKPRGGTDLALISNLSKNPVAEELQGIIEVFEPFTCSSEYVYVYSPPMDTEDTNGKVTIYRIQERI